MGRIRQLGQFDTQIVASSKRSRRKTLVLRRDNQCARGRKKTAGTRVQNVATRLSGRARDWAELLPCFVELTKRLTFYVCCKFCTSLVKNTRRLLNDNLKPIR